MDLLSEFTSEEIIEISERKKNRSPHTAFIRRIKLSKKAEQQAFAGKGLDFVTKVYLPERLSEMGMI